MTDIDAGRLAELRDKLEEAFRLSTKEFLRDDNPPQTPDQRYKTACEALWQLIEPEVVATVVANPEAVAAYNALPGLWQECERQNAAMQSLPQPTWRSGEPCTDEHIAYADAIFKRQRVLREMATKYHDTFKTLTSVITDAIERLTGRGCNEAAYVEFRRYAINSFSLPDGTWVCTMRFPV